VPKKIRETKKILRRAGFDYRQAKGSHTVWFHPEWDGRIVIARKDGDDTPDYLEQQVRDALLALEQSQEENE
jgi:predicted RNA binding protein YcfA (HicA-like mRNA interferase family)